MVSLCSWLLLLGVQCSAPLSIPVPARPPPVKHFVNLSNGIEAIDKLAAAGVPVEAINFCRIQVQLRLEPSTAAGVATLACTTPATLSRSNIS